MESIDRRLELIEARRKMGKAQLVRQTLGQLSDTELEALEESLDAEAQARGEQPPPMNGFLEEIWEEIQQQEAARP